jgi:hypothetical protein
MAITDGYASLEDVKGALRLVDTVDDVMLEIAIEAASREIDGYTQRVFTSNAGTRIYVPMDNYVTEIDDLSVFTSLESSSDGKTFDVTWTATDYQLEPLNGIAGGLTQPWTQIRAVGDYTFPHWSGGVADGQEATVRVVGTFGWATVPTAVRQACIVLSLRLWKRFDSPLGVAGFGDMGAMRVGRIDPDVQALLQPFVKVRMA